MRMQASLEFLLIGSAVAAMCLFTLTFYSRNLLSESSALARAADSVANSSPYYSQPWHLFNYTPQTTTVYYAQYSASISGRNEEIAYALDPPSEVINLTQFSHCTQVGFYGNPFGIDTQCGSTNAWMYFGSYDCGRMSGAYCIMPQSTGYSLEGMAGGRTYVYSFSLQVYTPSGVLLTQISSANATSPIMLNGAVVGNATVAEASSIDPTPSPTLLLHGNSSSAVNQSQYSVYEQELNALVPMLAFYNGTGVADSTAASIQQAIGAYATSQVRLLGAGVRASCPISEGSYLCPAASPFLYLINLTLSPSLGMANQTLSYLGSSISVRS
ncbi:MAG: hypothetical protein KGI04_00225 [Candidatus Micrarchaeota archaeon]|nr:hypothetical protein [Candidatus Micrarchaeota archaeon]